MRSKIEIRNKVYGIKTEQRMLRQEASALRLTGPGSIARRQRFEAISEKLAKLAVEIAALRWVLEV